MFKDGFTIFLTDEELNYLKSRLELDEIFKRNCTTTIKPRAMGTMGAIIPDGGERNIVIVLNLLDELGYDIITSHTSPLKMETHGNAYSSCCGNVWTLKRR